MLHTLLLLHLKRARHLKLRRRQAAVELAQLLEQHIALLQGRCEFLLELLLDTLQLLLGLGGLVGRLLKKLLVRELHMRVGLRVPRVLPVPIRSNELGLRQARSRLLEQVALMHLVRPHLMPCRPAHRELPVHHALEPKLRQVLHALLLLLLKLLLGEAHHLGLLTAPVQHRRTRVGELLA